MALRLDARDLAAHPDFAAGVAAALAGEPRSAFVGAQTADLPAKAPGVRTERRSAPDDVGTIRALKRRAAALLERRFSLATLAAVILAGAGVVAGLLWASPVLVAPGYAGWTLQASLPGEVAALFVAHMPRWAAALVALAGGAILAKWGGRWLVALARLGVLVGAIAVAWAVIR